MLLILNCYNFYHVYKFLINLPTKMVYENCISQRNSIWWIFCYRSNLLLFDFQNVTDLSNWLEISDTVRYAGRSKASFDLYKTKINQSAIFFSLLNPLPNGACFSGVRTMTQLNLDGYRCLHFVCKATGNATTYKIILRHNNLHTEPNPSFEQKFKVCTSITIL